MTNEFKGTINGIDFYNVKDYNEYLTELIKKGADINAQSNTNITNIRNTSVPDSDENTAKPGCCCGSGECKDKLIDGGYVPFFEEGDEYYLDNEKLDVDTAVAVFDEFVKTLNNRLNNLCPCQLNDYLNTVSDIRGTITSDDSFAKNKCDELEKTIEKYTEGINKIQEELEKVQNKHRWMKEFEEKIHAFDQFYKYLESEIEKKIEIKKLEKKIEDKGLGSRIEITPKTDQKPDNSATAKTKESDIYDGYRRLLKAIFDED